MAVSSGDQRLATTLADLGWEAMEHPIPIGPSSKSLGPSTMNQEEILQMEDENKIGQTSAALYVATQPNLGSQYDFAAEFTAHVKSARSKQDRLNDDNALADGETLDTSGEGDDGKVCFEDHERDVKDVVDVKDVANVKDDCCGVKPDKKKVYVESNDEEDAQTETASIVRNETDCSDYSYKTVSENASRSCSTKTYDIQTCRENQDSSTCDKEKRVSKECGESPNGKHYTKEESVVSKKSIPKESPSKESSSAKSKGKSTNERKTQRARTRSPVERRRTTGSSHQSRTKRASPVRGGHYTDEPTSGQHHTETSDNMNGDHRDAIGRLDLTGHFNSYPSIMSERFYTDYERSRGHTRGPTFPSGQDNGSQQKVLLELMTKGLGKFTNDMADIVIAKLQPENETFARKVGQEVKDSTITEIKELQESLADAKTEIKSLCDERDENKNKYEKELDVLRKELASEKAKRLKDEENRKELIEKLERDNQKLQSLMKDKDKLMRKADHRAKAEEQKRVKMEEEHETKLKEVQKELDKMKSELSVMKARKRLQTVSTKYKEGRQVGTLISHHGMPARQWAQPKNVPYDEGDPH